MKAGNFLLYRGIHETTLTHRSRRTIKNMVHRRLGSPLPLVVAAISLFTIKIAIEQLLMIFVRHI